MDRNGTGRPRARRSCDMALSLRVWGHGCGQRRRSAKAPFKVMRVLAPYVIEGSHV